MSTPHASDRSVPVVGGDFLRGLDLPSATRTEEERGSSASMLTSEERALLTALVRETWRGEGVIVDAGSFLGSSLIAEAEGLRDRLGRDDVSLDHFPAGRAIHGFERGFNPAPANAAETRSHRYGDIEVVLGESFVPQLEANLGAHRDLVELHIGDLNEQRWDGSPVEIAFVDVCKTAELNAHVSRDFYPALLPGASTLVHQDFFFDQLPWLRVTMGQLAEHVTWEGQVSTSSIYRTTSRIPESLVARDPFLEGSLEECLALHDAVAFPGIDRATELMLALSRVELVTAKGTPRDALDLLRQTAVDYADVAGATSREDSYTPAWGSPETMTPRYRLDRVIGRVIARDIKAAAAPRPSEAEAGGPGGGPSAPTPRQRARAALARRDFEEARSLLRADELAAPDLVLLARTELESGHPDRAEDVLTDLLRRRPRNGPAHALLGRIHLMRGDGAVARDEVEAALEANPALPVARRLLFDVEVVEALARRTR